MREIRLMAEYGCWPLWGVAADELGDIDPHTLPISDTLKARLVQWSDDWEATYDEDDPRNSAFESQAAQDAFKARGHALGEALQAELGPEWRVIVRI